MRRAALLLFVPALVQAEGAASEVQAIVAGTRARLMAYAKEQSAWLEAGKPFKDFPGTLAKEAQAAQARLAKARRPEVRHALAVAVTAFQQYDPKGAGKAKKPDLSGIPALSPAWSISPQMIFVALQGMKDPAAVKAFMAEAREHHADPDVRKHMLFWAVLGGIRERQEAEYAAALAKLEAQFPDDPLTREARKEVASLSLVTVGKPAPAFSIASMDDPKRTLTLEGFRGKYLLVDFWATWCAPCVAMLPTVHKLYAEYRPRGLEILSVADDKSAEEVQAFRRKPGMAMPWNHAVCIYDSKARKRSNTISDDYGIHELPTLVLIGPDGKVLAKGEELHQHLEEVLARFIPSQAVPGPR